jgi:putative lipase involved disintegration of autophagic bodies
MTEYEEFPECNCKVNKYFYEAFESVWYGIEAQVKSLKAWFPGFTIKVTGHSMGGALAQLAGMNLVYEGYNVSMINFGAPRVGDQMYAEFSNRMFPN